MDEAVEYAVREWSVLARCGEEECSQLGKSETWIACPCQREWKVKKTKFRAGYRRERRCRCYWSEVIQMSVLAKIF